ncbi:MAG TPA: sialidase family protein [Candidatus Thermoplasmatota archaeon]|nr:sialidase family protein [Candidatus Thermoplasmatota archaeon]
MGFLWKAAAAAVVLLLAGCTESGPPTTRLPASETDPPGGGVELFATGFVGPEPTIGVDNDGNVFVGAGDDVIRSTDQGKTWKSVHQYRREGTKEGSLHTFDPYLFLDPETQRVWISHLRPGAEKTCVFFAFTDDDGATWTTRDRSCPRETIDHQKIAVAGLGPSTSSADQILNQGKRPLYLCYSTLSFIRDNSCAVSFDDALTWSSDDVVITRSRNNCGGLGGVQAVGPDDTVVIMTSWACKAPTFAITRDNGASWAAFVGPSDTSASHSIDPELAIASEGTYVAVWKRSDERLHIAALTGPKDAREWKGPWPITPSDVKTTVFETVALGAGDQIGFAFLGTRDYAGLAGSAPNTTKWHLFVGAGPLSGASTGDGFLVRQVTPPNDPVQVGPICLPNQACPTEARNLLEFIDSSFGPDGSYWVAYADGCITNACKQASPPDASLSRDRQAFVARWKP